MRTISYEDLNAKAESHLRSRLGTLANKVEAQFSVFETVRYEPNFPAPPQWTVTNQFEDRAWEGLGVIRVDADPFFGGADSRTYESPVLESPTWADVFIHFALSQLSTGNGHHIFLEGLSPAKGEVTEDGVQVFKLHLGS